MQACTVQLCYYSKNECIYIYYITTLHIILRWITWRIWRISLSIRVLVWDLHFTTKHHSQHPFSSTTVNDFHMKIQPLVRVCFKITDTPNSKSWRQNYHQFSNRPKTKENAPHVCKKTPKPQRRHENKTSVCCFFRKPPRQGLTRVSPRLLDSSCAVLLTA